MGARAISSATISFGLVSIPVKLFTTQQTQAQLSFRMLHECGARLKQHYFCSRCEKEVPREEIRKGYEVAKGQYVVFAPEELKALEEETTKRIDIHEFVPVEQVDAIYFDRAYYLGPDKGGDKPYRLLVDAMRETGRAALATHAARGKQYLALLRPFEDGLLLQQLHYADEIKPFEEIERGDAEVKPAELKLAKQLIEQIASEEFHPERYRDEVKERIEQAIQRKLEGEEIQVAEAEEPRAQIIDLMDALKASLEKEGAASGASRSAASRKGPKRAARGKARKGRARAGGRSKDSEE